MVLFLTVSGLVGQVDDEQIITKKNMSTVIKYSKGILHDEMRAHNRRCDLIP